MISRKTLQIIFLVKKKVVPKIEKTSEIVTTKEELITEENPKKKTGVKDSVYKRNDFQKVLDQHISFLKDKFKSEREKNKNKYGIASDDDEDEEEVEEEEDVEEVDSFDDENKVYVEKIPYSEDFNAQKYAEEHSDDSGDDDVEPTASYRSQFLKVSS